MSECIHNTLEEARAACIAYIDAIDELQEKYGVSEENEDCCTTIYIFAKYRNESGAVNIYCYH